MRRPPQRDRKPPARTLAALASFFAPHDRPVALNKLGSLGADEGDLLAVPRPTNRDVGTVGQADDMEAPAT
jgi:hypothetical protein